MNRELKLKNNTVVIVDHKAVEFLYFIRFRSGVHRKLRKANEDRPIFPFSPEYIKEHAYMLTLLGKGRWEGMTVRQDQEYPI